MCDKEITVQCESVIHGQHYRSVSSPLTLSRLIFLLKIVAINKYLACVFFLLWHYSDTEYMFFICKYMLDCAENQHK